MGNGKGKELPDRIPYRGDVLLQFRIILQRTQQPAPAVVKRHRIGRRGVGEVADIVFAPLARRDGIGALTFGEPTFSLAVRPHHIEVVTQRGGLVGEEPHPLVRRTYEAAHLPFALGQRIEETPLHAVHIKVRKTGTGLVLHDETVTVGEESHRSHADVVDVFVRTLLVYHLPSSLQVVHENFQMVLKPVDTVETESAGRRPAEEGEILVALRADIHMRRPSARQVVHMERNRRIGLARHRIFVGEAPRIAGCRHVVFRSASVRAVKVE